MLVQDYEGISVDIKRLNVLTAEEFRSEHLEKQLPVVIAGGAGEWPALSLWTKEYLSGVAGDFMMSVKSKTDYGDSGSKRVGEKADDISLGDLLEIIFESEIPQDISYARQSNILSCVPELVRDMRKPRYLPANTQCKDGLLWVGPSGTVAQMHWDSADNLFVQVKGQKKFILSPPMHSHFTYPNKFSLIDSLKYLPAEIVLSIKGIMEAGGVQVNDFVNLLPQELLSIIGGLLASYNNCDVNAEFPDFSQHPLFRFADRYYATLDEGDIIYIPYMWRHYVRSTENSISVNWFFKDFSITDSLHEKNKATLKKTIAEHLVLGGVGVS